MNRTIGTPEGTRERLFAECAACRRIENAVTGVFVRQGYCELTTPNVEYFDVITATGNPLSQESMMKIVDRTGKILVMRPDNTVAIGRLAATKMKTLPLPLRLYYNQTVFRSDDIHTGARSEIDQCGVELIGTDSVRGDLEVISMAIDSLDACGVEDYHIEIGHIGYFQALLDCAGIEEAVQEKLKTLIEQKNIVDYLETLTPYLDTPGGKALRNLPRLFGGVEVLGEARSLCDDPKAQKVIDYLETIYTVLGDAGLSDRVYFDLGLIQTIEYYTGMTFRGFVAGAGSNVISGGRYDKLIGNFGKEVPATGFALDVEAVAGCLSVPEHQRPEILVWYEAKAFAKAKEIVVGEAVQTAMLSCGETPEEAEQEARLLGAKRLILVRENGTQEVVL